MGSRGRRSSADLAAVPRIGPDNLPTRPSAPEGFSEREREIWTETVESLPVDWFQPGDIPLLSAYAKACRYYEDISDQCDAAIEKGDFTVFSGKDSSTEAINPIFKLQDLALNQMARLAVKLRLTQSARMVQTGAANKAKKGNASKLWAN